MVRFYLRQSTTHFFNENVLKFQVFWLCPPTDKNLKMYVDWVQLENKPFFPKNAEGLCKIFILVGVIL